MMSASLHPRSRKNGRKTAHPIHPENKVKKALAAIRPWRERAKSHRVDPIDPQTMATNAALYAEIGCLFGLLSKLEKSQTRPSTSYAQDFLDSLIAEKENRLGNDAPVMGPLMEFLNLVEQWQKDHLVDEATLAEVLVARLAMAINTLPEIEPKEVLTRRFVKAHEAFESFN